MYHRYFAEMLSEYPEHTDVYADGYFLQGTAGSAFV
jgi:hypothetical protein